MRKENAYNRSLTSSYSMESWSSVPSYRSNAKSDVSNNDCKISKDEEEVSSNVAFSIGNQIVLSKPTFETQERNLYLRSGNFSILKKMLNNQEERNLHLENRVFKRLERLKRRIIRLESKFH